MRRTAFMLVAAVGLIGLVGAGEASAQSDAEPMSASILIPTLITIDVSSDEVTFPSPTLGDYDSPGYVAMSSAETTISTRANILHRVTISTADAFMTGGAGTKPSSHLQWSPSAAGTFNGVSQTGADVVTDLSRGVHATAAQVWYRMLLDETVDEPDTYTLAFTFTALAN